MENKEKLQQLYELKTHIESKAFQDNVMKPLFTELDKLKNAYDCKTLTELATLKGKQEGLKFIIGLLSDIESDIKNLKDEIEESNK